MFDRVQHLTEQLSGLNRWRTRVIQEQAGWNHEGGTPMVTADLADIDYFVSVYSQVLQHLLAEQLTL